MKRLILLATLLGAAAPCLCSQAKKVESLARVVAPGELSSLGADHELLRSEGMEISERTLGEVREMAEYVGTQGEFLALRLGDRLALVPKSLASASQAALLSLDGREKPSIVELKSSMILALRAQLGRSIDAGNIKAAQDILAGTFGEDTHAKTVATSMGGLERWMEPEYALTVLHEAVGREHKSRGTALERPIRVYLKKDSESDHEAFARKLSSRLFGSDKSVLRVDLASGGLEELVEPLRAQPNRVVLLENIDKAPDAVFEALLRMLDPRNMARAVVLMTSRRDIGSFAARIEASRRPKSD